MLTFLAMSCWRVRNAADDLAQPAAAGRRSAPRNKIMACLYCVVIILGVLLCGFAVFRLADDVAGHYVVKISIEASEFRSIMADDGSTMSSPVKVKPSFNVTARVENHYHHHIRFRTGAAPCCTTEYRSAGPLSPTASAR